MLPSTSRIRLTADFIMGQQLDCAGPTANEWTDVSRCFSRGGADEQLLGLRVEGTLIRAIADANRSGSGENSRRALETRSDDQSDSGHNEPRRQSSSASPGHS